MSEPRLNTDSVQHVLVVFIRALHDTGVPRLYAPEIELAEGDVRGPLEVLPHAASVGSGELEVTFKYPRPLWDRLYTLCTPPYQDEKRREAEELLETLRELMPDHDPEIVRMETIMSFIVGED